MAYPAGIITRPVNFGPAFELEDGDTAGMQVTFKATRDGVLWMATGSPAISVAITRNADDGAEQTVDLPVTDQDGWGDGDGNAIVPGEDGHVFLYIATVIFTQNGRTIPGSKPRSKVIPIPQGDLSPLDLDKLIPLTSPGGTVVSVPDIWSEQIAQAEAAALAAAGAVIDSAAFVGSEIATTGTPAEVAVAEKIETATLTVPSPGADVDCGPLLQEAFDLASTVLLMPDQTYFVNTPVYLDGASITRKYVLEARGARVILGSDLPAASTWDIGISTAPGTAFFNGSLRGGLTGGVVDTSEANAGSASSAQARFVIKRARLAATTPVCVAFGGTGANGINGSSTGLEHCTFENVFIGATGSGYADGDYQVACEVLTNLPGSQTRMIYRRASGDALQIIRPKAYGAYVCDIAGSAGFLIDQPVGGQINIISSSGRIVGGHQETDEISSTLPWSISIDRSHVTVEDQFTRRSNDPSHPSIRINDTLTTPNYAASEVTINNWRTVANYNAGQGDSAKGVDLRIVALNKGGVIRVENSRSIVIRSGTSVGWEGLWVTAADADIQAALTVGADLIASGSWKLHHDGAWKVSPLSSAPQQHALIAPSLTAAADSLLAGGTLTQGTTYEYVAAVKTASGSYSPLSSVAQVAAAASKVNAVTITNTSGPVTVALWRKSSAGVASAPDRYIEVPLDGHQTLWVDSGANLNGRPWRTTSIPVPDTVKSTGPQALFPRTIRKAADESVTNSNTLQNDDELAFPLAANSTYSFESVVFYDAAQAADAKFAFAIPAGASIVFGQFGAFTAATSNSGSVSYAVGATGGAQAANMGAIGVGSKIMAAFRGTIVTGATAGEVRLQWSQATSDASSITVSAGSTLGATKLT